MNNTINAKFTGCAKNKNRSFIFEDLTNVAILKSNQQKSGIKAKAVHRCLIKCIVPKFELPCPFNLLDKLLKFIIFLKK